MTIHSAKSPGFLSLLSAAFVLSIAQIHAQTLPPSTPTLAPAPPATPAPPPPLATHRAQIDFTSQLLTITADNSSLNQILRDISRITGMTITGGVTDEHVFGTYGPADPSSVLTALLKGTGSNMLLVLDAARSPRELVLTPRQGGPTPPSPNSYRSHDEDNDVSPQGNNRFGRQPSIQPPPPPPQQQPQPQPPEQPQYPQTPAVNTDNPAPTPPAADTTTQQSPNGVKTPQQIYEELMKMQKKTTTPPAQ